MEDKILKHRKKINGALTIVLMFTLISSHLGFTVFAQEEDTEAIDVTATVQAWLNINIQDTALELDQPLIEADGTTNVGTASAGIELGTSNPGWALQVESSNAGLLQEGEGTHQIDTVSSAPTLLEGGVDGYGVSIDPQIEGATAEEGYGFEGDNVGPVQSASSTQILTSTEANETQSVGTLYIKAAANDTTPAGDYQDQIIITGTTQVN